MSSLQDVAIMSSLQDQDYQHGILTYLLIGAGCFGASTALYLKRRYPDANVFLVDRTEFPCPSAAAHDLNKIIRAEYEDPVYMKLAIQAQALWRSDPILQPFYHETGIIFAGTEGPGLSIIKNYTALIGSSPAQLMDPEDARVNFGGIFRDADWPLVEKCTWNPNAGWGEAENALRSVIQAAIDSGVKYVKGSVQTLSFNTDGSCYGACLEGGEEMKADRVVLCTGAYTAKLLADSAPHRPELQVDGRMVAAAAIMCASRVPESEMEKFKTAPIVIHPMGDTPGESIPPGSLGLLKCTHELSFTNNIFHEASQQTISVPPERTSQSTWSQEVPQRLKDETLIVRDQIYGRWVNGLEVEYYRMCWDAVTPNQDFIISPHPHSQNLSIAGGGSFHSWKFLANIGSYVVDMLEGTLDDEKSKKWAWDRSNEGGACATYSPSRDLKDIKGYTEMVASF